MNHAGTLIPKCKCFCVYGLFLIGFYLHEEVAMHLSIRAEKSIKMNLEVNLIISEYSAVLK